MDIKPPSNLKEMQSWFLQMITNPLQEDGTIQPLSFKKTLVEDEVKAWVKNSGSLPSYKRLEIYNQQYWWRLTNILEKSYPFVLSIMGKMSFQQKLAIPYLLDFPSRHWSLDKLGEKVKKWTEKNYFEKNKNLILHAVSLDHSFHRFLFLEKKPLLKVEEVEENPNKKCIFLQPFLQTFSFPYDLLSYRKSLLKNDPDPLLRKEKPRYYFLVYRTEKHIMSFKELEKMEYLILLSFEKGSTLDQISYLLEKQGSKKDFSNFSSWLSSWVQKGWLADEK